MTYWANSVTGSEHSACTQPMLNILVLQASGVLIKNGTYWLSRFRDMHI